MSETKVHTRGTAWNILEDLPEEDATTRKYARENRGAPGPLSGSAIEPVHRTRAERDKAAIERVSTSPQVDHLVSDLYSIMLLQTERLRKRSETGEELDAAEMGTLGKLVDGVVRLTKLQIEREKLLHFDDLDEEELAKELEAAAADMRGEKV